MSTRYGFWAQARALDTARRHFQLQKVRVVGQFEIGVRTWLLGPGSVPEGRAGSGRDDKLWVHRIQLSSRAERSADPGPRSCKRPNISN